MIKKCLMAAAVLTLLTVLGASAAQAQYSPSFITCSPTTVAPGGSVTCEAGYFDPGSTVTWTLDGKTVGTSVANASGVATITFKVPEGYSAGNHTVVASGTAKGSPTSAKLTLEAGITVTGASTTAAPSGTSTLPRTGSDSGMLATVAAGLIVAGGLLVITSRQRRRHHISADS